MNKTKEKKYSKLPFECACGYTIEVSFDQPKTPMEAAPLIFKEVQRHNLEDCQLLKALQRGERP